MIILNYCPGIDQGQLKVLSKKNKIYVYTGVSPYIHRLIKLNIKHKSFGRAWQRLRGIGHESVR